MQEKIFKFGTLELTGLVNSKDEWYFHGSVVCVGCKLISEPSNASKYIKDNVPAKWMRVIRGATGRGAYYVTEPGLYKLILAATSDEGIEFSDWVVEEVLTSIRKTSVYYDKNAFNEEEKQQIESAIKSKDERIAKLELENKAINEELEVEKTRNFQMTTYMDDMISNIKTNALSNAKEEVKTETAVEFKCYTDAQNGDPLVYIEHLKKDLEKYKTIVEKQKVFGDPDVSTTAKLKAVINLAINAKTKKEQNLLPQRILSLLD